MENNLDLTSEMLEQASKAPSAAALFALAQENGITLTAEEATLYFAQLHPQSGAISDEELDNVSGGCGSEPPAKCKFCGCTEFHRSMPVKGLPSSWACTNCRQLS